MNSCAICNLELNPNEDAIWEGMAHMTCADAVVGVVLDAVNSRFVYTRTIAESLLEQARLRLVREGVV